MCFSHPSNRLPCVCSHGGGRASRERAKTCSTFSCFLPSFATVLLVKSSPMAQSWGVGRDSTESVDTG